MSAGATDEVETPVKLSDQMKTFLGALGCLLMVFGVIVAGVDWNSQRDLADAKADVKIARFRAERATDWKTWGDDCRFVRREVATWTDPDGNEWDAASLASLRAAIIASSSITYGSREIRGGGSIEELRAKPPLPTPTPTLAELTDALGRNIAEVGRLGMAWKKRALECEAARLSAHAAIEQPRSSFRIENGATSHRRKTSGGWIVVEPNE